MQYRTGQSDTPVGPRLESSWVEGLWDAAPVGGQDSMLTKWRWPGYVGRRTANRGTTRTPR